MIAVAAALMASTPMAEKPAACGIELIVLGAGQDAGAPQIGNADDTGPRLLPSSLAIADHVTGERFLFDATPAITEQLALLDSLAPTRDGLGVDGVFITHAHIGHYLGLAYFGREAAGASNVPVFAMPRMAHFLRTNGPWSQLSELENIEIVELHHDGSIQLTKQIEVWQRKVPHRDEYSETVAFIVTVAGKKILYAPDFDGWPDLQGLADGKDDRPRYLEMMEVLAQLEVVDYAFIDATFWDDNELPGRDMSEIPHPRVTESMDLLETIPADKRAQVFFIHYNHTNPIRDPNSPESKQVLERGFGIARRGMRLCLSETHAIDGAELQMEQDQR